MIRSSPFGDRIADNAKKLKLVVSTKVQTAIKILALVLHEELPITIVTKEL
jgi:hypothetical protein